MSILRWVQANKFVTALFALVLVITIVSAIVPVLRPAVPLIIFSLVFTVFIFGVPYWAVQKGKPLRWYELLGLVIGYLTGVYSTVIFLNSLQEVYILAGCMFALSLIILTADMRFIIVQRKSR